MSAESDLGGLDLAAIETALRELQRAFPQINKDLFDRRDPLDDDVLDNMLAGYARVDQLVCDGVDIFAMGQLHHWLDLNATVLCGDGLVVRARHHRLLEATESRFYEQPNGSISDIMEWYALNGGKSVWRRATGVFIRVLSEPQLFIEGNHRTGALVMSYLLGREGRPPFVLTAKNAREFFNPSSVIKKTKKRSLSMQLKMPGLGRAFADYLQRQANPSFLLSRESALASTDSFPIATPPK
jgi:hypothetical protein